MTLSRDQLDTLVAVIETGTLDAAAGRLNVTPSAVSQRIKALEQQLGRVLIVRTKPARPTASGEALLRLARQQALLEHETLAELGLDGHTGTTVTIPLAVNADSLATWILAPLARVASERHIALDLHRDDQERTADLLAAGTVMAAVTSQSDPVPGCTVTPLGHMTYRAVATPAFRDRWFADGATAASFGLAPVVEFDRHDTLQTRFLHAVSRRPLTPPRHYVPASADFALAVRLGLGWGMLPDAQTDLARRAGELVDLPAGRPIEVPLYWQQWNLRSPLLDAIADAVTAEARQVLT